MKQNRKTRLGNKPSLFAIFIALKFHFVSSNFPGCFAWQNWSFHHLLDDVQRCRDYRRTIKLQVIQEQEVFECFIAIHFVYNGSATWSDTQGKIETHFTLYTRLNHPPGNGVATDQMTVFWGYF